jgi:tetratricopeptide (TPR) repeat protein
MVSSQKRPDDALEMLNSIEESSLKQVLALQWFEKSMNNMYLHNYEACSEAFLKMIELNKWSHGLYYYISGSALVERYRELKATDPEKAVGQLFNNFPVISFHTNESQPEMAKRAKELLDKVQSHVGKRTIMAKRLPFDVFVSRKIQKWEQRAKDWEVDLVDAIGVSPIEEMIYFWNGYKRMRPEHLEVCLKNLGWSSSDQNPHWEKEDLDEQAIASVLRATVLRNLQRMKEARAILEEEVICHPWEKFKGGFKDNWTLPIAHYEMGVNHWQEYHADGGDKANLDEALQHLEKVSSWETFDLDARYDRIFIYSRSVANVDRIGMRVTTGRDTIKRELAAISETGV